MDARSDDVIRIGSLELRFLVDETRAGGSVVVFEFVVPPNARVPAPHYHREVDEVVYVLDGTVTTTLDGRKQELRRGESLFVPRGSVHNHENFHPETARALITLTPGSIGRRYFEEVAREVNVPGKPDLAKIKETCCGMVSCRPEGDAGLVGLRVRWPLSIGSDYARPIPQAGDGLDRELLCRRFVIDRQAAPPVRHGIPPGRARGGRRLRPWPAPETR